MNYNIKKTMEQIKQLYSSYLSKDEYVYKTHKNCIIILKKIEKTITNEVRENVKDINFALFRGDTFYVEKIFNKNEPTKTISYLDTNIQCLSEMKFIENQIVNCVSYDYNLNNIYGDGIYYYKSIEPAFYRDNPKYKFKSWYYNGIQKMDITDEDEEGTYLMTEWHSDGTKKLEGMCRSNKRIGKWKSYDPHGNDYNVSIKETNTYDIRDCCSFIKSSFMCIKNFSCANNKS